MNGHCIGPERAVGYIEQYYTTSPGGTPRHIARTIDDSPSAAKYHSLACMWYDMLKPDISDPFYIECNRDSCVLHVDHSESMGWPVMLVVELPEDCCRDLLNDVLTAVTGLKKYMFYHWMDRDTAKYTLRSDTAACAHTVCHEFAPSDYTVIFHSRTLGTYSCIKIHENADPSYIVPEHLRIRDELKTWARMCSTHSISDLRNMARH